MRRQLVLLPLLAACTPHGTDTSEPDAPCEREWMRQFAATEGLEIRACAELSLDDDDEPEPVAQLCDAEGWRAVYLVDDETTRWAVGHDGWGHVPICGPDILAPGATSFSLDDVGPGEIERRSVALEHGRPTVVEHRYDSIREPVTPSIGATLAIDEVG